MAHTAGRSFYTRFLLGSCPRLSFWLCIWLDFWCRPGLGVCIWLSLSFWFRLWQPLLWRCLAISFSACLANKENNWNQKIFPLIKSKISGLLQSIWLTPRKIIHVSRQAGHGQMSLTHIWMTGCYYFVPKPGAFVLCSKLLHIVFTASRKCIQQGSYFSCELPVHLSGNSQKRLGQALEQQQQRVKHLSTFVKIPRQSCDSKGLIGPVKKNIHQESDGAVS